MSGPTIPRSAPSTTLATRLLGFTGAALLLTAAISLVSARWELFGPGARLAALLAASAVLVLVTHHVRRMAPATARSLDVLIAAMLPVDTAAAAIVSGGDWRVAIAAAGPVSFATGLGLRRRDMPVIADGAVFVGGLLATAGVATLFDLHGPALIAGLALVTSLVFPTADRHLALAWAVVAGFAPVGRLFDEAVFTGMGTLRELGLLDPVDLLPALATGLASVLAVMITAARTRSASTWPIAAGLLATTGFEAWAIAEPPPEVGVLAVVAAAAIMELVSPRRLPLAPETAIALERLNEFVLLSMTALMTAASLTMIADRPIPLAETPMIAGVLTVAWIIGDLRRDGRWAASLPGAVTTGSTTAYLVVGDGLALGIALLVGAVLAGSAPRPGRTTVALMCAALAPVASAADAGADSIMVVAVLAALAAAAVAGRDAVDPDDGRLGAGVLIVLVHGLFAGLSAVLVWDPALAAVVVTTVWWVGAMLLHRGSATVGLVVRAVALVGPLVAAAHDPTIGVALATAVVAVSGVEARMSPSAGRRAVATAGVTVAYLATLIAFDVTLLDAYVIPVLWLVIVVAARCGADASELRPGGLLLSGALALVSRVLDGEAGQTAILGLLAVAVAVWASRDGDRRTLVLAVPLAVGTALFDLLDRSVGVQAWGWLVIGGATAVIAAVVLERGDRGAEADTSVR